jgi:hypothetical protein
MNAKSRFETIQLRAYEIYCSRSSASGTPEDDWREAEAQLEREEAGGSGRLGPARLIEKSHWGALATHQGEDFENPA